MIRGSGLLLIFSTVRDAHVGHTNSCPGVKNTSEAQLMHLYLYELYWCAMMGMNLRFRFR